ncbi:GCN5-related N-acetyltransferase [Parvibaculum lavamentivorans DS-1]|uniref:GCN5-related N-acetyltransferase n=1 Tax=Parvibaculum lavamentivorans (strain DS-1 / DSM 13023 / NCIMB 13966) TaxID=402881 RepID=A7HUR9_PARL1|nr:GNAT family N-acetyltransferase [Parvibaculum lavamentivorans]ABS63652.1 GCN5-related N-acetyltransferase [Parvibaculum lavamentivorans DS-1]
MTVMNADTIVLAEAGPGEPDLAARLIYDTGSYVFDCLYDRDFEAFLKITGFQWQQQGGAFSHVHARAALHDGNLAGIALGFPQSLYEQEFGTAMIAMAEKAGPDLIAHLPSVAGHIPWLFPDVPDDAWYLLFLSAHPQARGRGIGEKLLVDCYERARKAGCASLHLDVASVNPALRFYERMGLERLVESAVPKIAASHGVPSHIRMVKHLV